MLPKHVRDDIVQEMVLAYLTGEAELADIRDPMRMRKWTGAYHKLFETWRTTSLDAPLYDDSGLSRIDRLESDVEHW